MIFPLLISGQVVHISSYISSTEFYLIYLFDYRIYQSFTRRADMQ